MTVTYAPPLLDETNADLWQAWCSAAEEQWKVDEPTLLFRCLLQHAAGLEIDLFPNLTPEDLAPDAIDGGV